LFSGDPDVQDSRFRFFMEELRSRMLSLTSSLTPYSRSALVRGTKIVQQAVVYVLEAIGSRGADSVIGL
jgi:hypothetical protein